MPVHLRALVVIMAVSVVMLWLVRPMACAHAIQPADYRRRAGVWIALTLLSFLSHNYWVFVMLSVPLLLIVSAKDPNPLGFYFFLIVAVPPFPAEIPAPGALRYLIEVNHLRWLSLAVLLPAYLKLRTKPDTVPFGRTNVDKFVLAYVLLWIGLQVGPASLTHLLRICFYMAIDVILPYYVASRALRDLPAFRDTVMSFVVAVLLMVPLAVFEFGRRWLLYNGLEGALGIPYWGMGNYLMRGEAFLRASVATGHPIVLGYMMAVALGLTAYLRPFMPGKRHWLVVMAALFIGLVAAMSRGPWVGAAATLLLLVVTGPNVGSKMLKTLAFGLVALPLALMTEQGQKMIDYLPFVGTVESQNVEFRQRLFEVSLGVIAQNPLFGSLGLQTDMEQMRGSDGIIDVVNTYVLVALQSGLVGLTLFTAPFVLVGAGLARALHAMRDKTTESHLLGRALLAALVGIAIIIATVSSISTVPAVYLAVIGMGAGYVRLVARGLGAGVATQTAPVVARGGIRRGRRLPI